MSIATQIRWMFIRRPLLWWLLIAALAVAAAMTAAHSMQGVEAARRSWGSTATVWITTVDTPTGASVHTEQRAVPLAIVPVDAVRTAPGDAIARRHLGVGEIVVTDDVTPKGIAGLMPAGTVAIGVPVHTSPHLTVGDAVIAYANGARVADGMIVAIDDEQVIVAVAQGDAAGLALAVPGGAVIVGMVP